MIKLYEICPGGYWTGRTCEQPDDHVVPSGWTAREVPALTEGQHAVLAPDGWQITDAPPPVIEPAQPQAVPELVITAISADAEHEASTLVQSVGEVTCAAGATLTFTAELRGADGQPLPVSDVFRLPIRARDGREKVLLATMVDGVVTITAPMRESGVWSATAAGVNEALPDAAKMSFAGATVYVCEAP